MCREALLSLLKSNKVKRLLGRQDSEADSGFYSQANRNSSPRHYMYHSDDENFYESSSDYEQSSSPNSLDLVDNEYDNCNQDSCCAKGLSYFELEELFNLSHSTEDTENLALLIGAWLVFE